jgi:hypothetical protein
MPQLQTETIMQTLSDIMLNHEILEFVLSGIAHVRFSASTTILRGFEQEQAFMIGLSECILCT